MTVRSELKSGLDAVDGRLIHLFIPCHLHRETLPYQARLSLVPESL